MFTRLLASVAVLGLTAGMAAAEYKMTIFCTQTISTRALSRSTSMTADATRKITQKASVSAVPPVWLRQ